MSILRYSDYVLEKMAYDMILESKVIYSKKFINLLIKMKTNKLSKELLNLYSKEVDDLTQNYIDITDEKDAVSFTSDKKVQKLTKDKPETWMVTDSGKYLTKSDRNNKIFEALGYDKVKYECWSPEKDAVGLILSEAVSKSGKIYVMFQEYKLTGEPRIGVMNKEGLKLSDDEDMRVWSTSRNPIKIGRLVRAILNAAKIKFVDKDIEDFTNTYKATYDFTKDALKQFDIVKGDEISYWYAESSYVGGGGSLNNSCMAHVETSEYFDIYTQNPQVSLVILYGDTGVINGDKYSDDKIKGRAILWDAKLDGIPVKFMDRIYTTHDADVELFKQFAEKNGWWFKRKQSMEPNESLTDGSLVKRGTIEVKLDDTNFEYYPYCDTICYINSDTGTACNVYWDDSDRLLRNTGGSYEDSYNMEG